MNEKMIFDLILKTLRECKKEAVSIFMSKYGKQCKSALELSIEQFYDDYTPRVYKRQEGLLKAFRINPDGTYDFDSKLIAGHHRVSNDYLFDLAFQRGYHGGADKNKNGWYAYHPETGTPYWRTPVPEYTQWGRKAEQTTPILAMVDEKIAIYNFDEKYENIVIDLMIKKLKSSGVFK